MHVCASATVFVAPPPHVPCIASRCNSCCHFRQRMFMHAFPAARVTPHGWSVCLACAWAYQVHDFEPFSVGRSCCISGLHTCMRPRPQPKKFPPSHPHCAANGPLEIPPPPPIGTPYYGLCTMNVLCAAHGPTPLGTRAQARACLRCALLAASAATTGVGKRAAP